MVQALYHQAIYLRLPVFPKTKRLSFSTRWRQNRTQFYFNMIYEIINTFIRKHLLKMVN